jgi:hypothetical protein
MSNWIAYFKDGSTLERFEGEKENSFKLVLDKQDQLQEFEVVCSGGKCKVNLDDGIFTLTKDGVDIKFHPLNHDNEVSPKDLKYRLVYYRRQLHFFGNDPVANDGITQFSAVGWQATTKDDRNIKRIIRINDEKIFELEI